MQVKEFLNMEEREKQDLISSRNIFDVMTEDNITKIITKERKKSIVLSLAAVLKQEKEIQEKLDFTPFINSLLDEDLPRIRQYVVCDILISMFYRREDDQKNKTDLKNFTSILKQINDPLLTVYSIQLDNHHKFFTTEIITDLFHQSPELEVLSFSAEGTKDLVDNSVTILNSVPTTDYKNLWIENNFHSGVESFYATILEETFRSGQYLNSEKIGHFLKIILEANDFPSNNPAIDNKIDNLYSGFIAIENLLFLADPKHRDHAFHSFHVFLTGLSILALYHEVFQIHNTYRGEDFLCWVMIAFFHDIGYGIQKIKEVTRNFEQHYRVGGSVKGPEFQFSEGFRLYGEEMIKKLNDRLLEDRIDSIHYETINTSLLESWERRDHGLMSALIMLKTIDEYKSKDHKFSDIYYPERWSEIFVRAGLAIAVHTLPENRNWEINVDYTPNRFTAFRLKPFFLSYLLSIIDSIEYLNRPRIIPTGEGMGEFTQIKDVNLKLNIRCTYTNSHYLHLQITADYTNYPFEELIKTAEGIYKRLQHFISEEWGLTVILQTTKEWEDEIFIKMKEAGLLPEKPIIKLLFQRREIEEFLSLFGSKLKDYRNQEEELHFSFLKASLFGLKIDPCDILIPASTSYDTSKNDAILLNNFFSTPIIDNFIPKTSIGFRRFIKRTIKKRN